MHHFLEWMPCIQALMSSMEGFEKMDHNMGNNALCDAKMPWRPAVQEWSDEVDEKGRS